jgi:hypothetical protein
MSITKFKQSLVNCCFAQYFATFAAIYNLFLQIILSFFNVINLSTYFISKLLNRVHNPLTLFGRPSASGLLHEELPEGVYTIVDPYGFTKSLFTIASALDFLWGRGTVHCRLLAVWTRTHQSADLYFVMVTSEEAKPIDFKIYRLSIDFQVVWIYWWIRPLQTEKFWFGYQDNWGQIIFSKSLHVVFVFSEVD